MNRGQNIGIKTCKQKYNQIKLVAFGCHHSHRKRKDSLESSLDRVLFGAELEFPKILVPTLPQHTSNINIECAGKTELSKKLYSFCVTSFLKH